MEGCVYILKTGKNLYKIGKTRDLQKRLASYHTHLPILFRVVRQYENVPIGSLEGTLHIILQHKRVKGEWFELTRDDLQVCDNVARNYTQAKLHRAPRGLRTLRYSDDPLLQLTEANEKYLEDYSRVAEDIRIGLDTEEIFALYEGTVSKAVIGTVRRLLQYQTPNSEYLGKWLPVVRDLGSGLPERRILEKYKGEVSRTTLSIVKRILRNQLY